MPLHKPNILCVLLSRRPGSPQRGVHCNAVCLRLWRGCWGCADLRACMHPPRRARRGGIRACTCMGDRWLTQLRVAARPTPLLRRGVDIPCTLVALQPCCGCSAWTVRRCDTQLPAGPGPLLRRPGREAGCCSCQHDRGAGGFLKEKASAGPLRHYWAVWFGHSYIAHACSWLNPAAFLQDRNYHCDAEARLPGHHRYRSAATSVCNGVRTPASLIRWAVRITKQSTTPAANNTVRAASETHTSADHSLQWLVGPLASVPSFRAHAATSAEHGDARNAAGYLT